MTGITDLDPKMTFDTFLVGPASRLAATAARRTAQWPGQSPSPLFIHAASGLGKTHLLRAAEHEAKRRDAERKVLYQVADAFLEELSDAIREGRQDALREGYLSLELLLLDDVQFLAGQAEAQEMLLSALDGLAGASRQVVLASDRPPDRIEGLGPHLLSRLRGGLIVGIAPPDYQTSVALIRQQAEDRGQMLAPGVAEALARYSFRHVRELQGALNRVLATQELEERSVTPPEVTRLMGGAPSETPVEASGAGPDEIVEDQATAVRADRAEPARERRPAAHERARPGGRWDEMEEEEEEEEEEVVVVVEEEVEEVEEVVVVEDEGVVEEEEEEEGPENEPWRTSLKRVAAAAEREGFVALRLRAFAERANAPPGWEEMLARFQEKLARLREIGVELKGLGNPWANTAVTVLRDPERLDEAEALLASVRQRQRAFGVLGPGPTLGDLEALVPPLAFKAVEQLVREENPRYNPLFFWGDPPAAAKALLGGAARSYRNLDPRGEVAVASAADFAEDFIRALSSGVAGAWRERWWASDLLFIHGLEALGRTERAQDEFFHLFEALRQRGSRILLAADRSPSMLEGIDQRLRSRFEGGLVLQVVAEGLPPGADDLTLRPAQAAGDPSDTA